VEKGATARAFNIGITGLSKTNCSLLKSGSIPGRLTIFS
jgi:hypothetical protein